MSAELVERYAEICEAQRRLSEMQKDMRQQILDMTGEPEVGQQEKLNGKDHALWITSYMARRLDRDKVAAFYKRHKAKLPMKFNVQTMVQVKDIDDEPRGFVDVKTMMQTLDAKIAEAENTPDESCCED